MEEIQSIEGGETAEFALEEFTSNSEIIYAASLVLATVTEIDTKLLDRSEAATFSQMKAKALRLMEFSIGELYYEVFGDDPC